MKKLRSTLLLAGIIITGLASAQAFDDGKNILSVGFGFLPTSNITGTLTQYQSYQDYNYKNYGTGVLKFEHGLNKYFGVGFCFEYSSAFITYQTPVKNFLGKLDSTYTTATNNQVMGFFLRLNGHYPIGDHLDIFAGVDLGYQYTVNSSNQTGQAANSTTNYRAVSFLFIPQFTIGARYMIKDHFGLFGEVGWAETTFQMGVTFGF